MALASILGCGATFATELPFSFGQGENLEFGTQKKETYEVAMRLEAGLFEGGKIVGINVPVRSSDISNVKLWLTHELKVELVDGKNVTVPDILEKNADVTEGLAQISLETPFVIPPEGVFIGYSFDVDNLVDDTKWPLFVSKSDSGEGFYLRTSRSYREWQNMSEERQIATELSAIIDYDFPDASAGLISLKSVRTNYGEPFSVPAIIENHGYEGVESIDFEYKFGNETGSTHYVIPGGIPAIYGRRLTVDLPFDKCNEKFNNTLDITITKVNGKENLDKSPSASGAINIIKHTSTHRIVMEEYTGTWCGFCVKGTAAVERMMSLYPDDFIPLVFHGGGSDPMCTMEIFPNYVSGYPHCWIDRAFDCDPYGGLHPEEFFGIEQTFLERRALPAPADVDVEASVDENFNINVVASVNFVEIPEHTYTLAYALLEDGMKGSSVSWAQSNYYAGNNPEKYIPEMERFCKGSSYVIDIEYNEVVVMAPDIMGVKGSVPFINTETPVRHEYVFPNVTEATNVYGDKVIQNIDNLSVVALLIDTSDGHIANAAKVKINETPGDVRINTERPAISDVKWINCDGTVSANPRRGLNIKVVEYTDGSRSTEKVMLR